jgi:hypothetical protein
VSFQPLRSSAAHVEQANQGVFFVSFSLLNFGISFVYFSYMDILEQVVITSICS